MTQYVWHAKKNPHCSKTMMPNIGRNLKPFTGTLYESKILEWDVKTQNKQTNKQTNQQTNTQTNKQKILASY